MKIQENVKTEIQQALNRQIPDPNDRDFAAFYSTLELEHPELAAKLVGALEDDPVEPVLFPEQLAQARTRSQARTITRSLFYRQDPYTKEWHLAKAKVGMAGLGFMLLLISPTLLLSPSSASKVASKPKIEAPKPKPAAVPAPPIKKQAPPPVVDSVPAAPVAPAPEPVEAFVPPPVAPAPVVVAAAPQPAPVAFAPAPRATVPKTPGGSMFRNKRDLGGVTLFKRNVQNTAQGNFQPASPDSSNTVFNKQNPSPSEPQTESQRDALRLSPGAIVPAALATGIVVAEGSPPVPVVVRTTTGLTFIGTAQLNAVRRMEISFKEVVVNGQSQNFNAQVFAPDGLPGIPVNTVDMAPSLVADLLRASAGGVSNFVQGLANSSTTTLVPGAGAVTNTQGAPLGASIAGSIANLFSNPPQQKALIRVAQVDRGTEVLVTVLSVPSRNNGR